MKNVTRTYSQFFPRSREIRFFLLLIVFFLAGHMINYLSRPYTEPFLVHTLTASVSSSVINTLTPNENTHTEEAIIRSERHAIDISEGCEGIEGILLLTAAILAFQAGIMAKIVGIVAGSLLLYVSNLVRIIGLFYIFKYKPELFEVMHIFVGQTFIIFIGIIFFLFWITTCAGTNESSR